MDENNRNTQSQSGGEQQSSESTGQQGSQQNANNEADQNPQDGKRWNNYRTREEAGNPGDSNSSDSGGGGTLY